MEEILKQLNDLVTVCRKKYTELMAGLKKLAEGEERLAEDTKAVREREEKVKGIEDAKAVLDAAKKLQNETLEAKGRLADEKKEFETHCSIRLKEIEKSEKRIKEQDEDLSHREAQLLKDSVQLKNERDEFKKKLNLVNGRV